MSHQLLSWQPYFYNSNAEKIYIYASPNYLADLFIDYLLLNRDILYLPAWSIFQKRHRSVDKQTTLQSKSPRS